MRNCIRSVPFMRSVGQFRIIYIILNSLTAQKDGLHCCLRASAVCLRARADQSFFGVGFLCCCRSVGCLEQANCNIAFGLCGFRFSRGCAPLQIRRIPRPPSCAPVFIGVLLRWSFRVFLVVVLAAFVRRCGHGRAGLQFAMVLAKCAAIMSVVAVLRCVRLLEDLKSIRYKLAQVLIRLYRSF